MLRLLIVVIGLLSIATTFFTNLVVLFWCCVVTTLFTFSIAVGLHRRIKRGIAEYEVWREIKLEHIARMKLDWASIPPSPIHLDDLHFLEIDFDLPLLHRLTSTATSREGSQRLREWLLNLKPDADVIYRRQALIRELIPLSTFRDRLTSYALLAARDTRPQRQPDSQLLIRWLERETPPRLLSPMLRILAFFAGLNAVLFVLASLNLIAPLWGITWTGYVLLYFSQWRTIKSLFEQAQTLADALRRIDSVMGYLERFPYKKQSQLGTLCAPFVEERPSHLLRSVLGTVSAASLQRNPYVWMLLNAIVPWDLYFIRRLYKQKAQLAARLPGWLDTFFEVEALSSLATFAYLNPDYRFPEITSETKNTFKAVAIGHPLIPDDTRICNNFTFTGLGQLAIITGSNMAGKSSFLRTLGVNLCLVYAGSVVNAQSLETTLFRLFSSIRVSDSLNDGISYFYAEVKRLKALLDELKSDDELPLFLLIDEIFRGTNNRERFIGSQSYVRALVNQHGVGLIATHDLELAKLAQEHSTIQNHHFREKVIDGQMVFDYILQPGPCPTTNALKIMEMEGLPVEADCR